MAHNLGDGFPLDLTKLFVVGKNTKTACYVRINVREYRRAIKMDNSEKLAI